MIRPRRKYALPAVCLLAMAPLLASMVYDAFRIHWCDWWPTFNYFVGYECGFGSRKLIGSTLGRLLPDMVTARHIRMLVLPACLLMLAGFVGVAWRALRRGGRPAVALGGLLAAYLVSPFSLVQWMSTGMGFGFMETYQLVLTLGWLLLYPSFRRRWWFPLLTALVAVACCLVHHTFCCTLFPLYVALFVYDALEGGVVRGGRAVAYGSLCLMLLALFVLLWKCSRMTVDIDTLYARIAARANHDVLPDKDGLRMLYYLTSDANAAGRVGQRWWDVRFAVEALLMSPLVALLCSPWVVAARRAGGRLSKWRYAAVPLAAVLLSVPVFFMATDYSRWWMCLTFALAVLPLVAHTTGDAVMGQALDSVSAFMRRRWWLMLLLVAYLVQLHPDLFNGLKESARMMAVVSDMFKL